MDLVCGWINRATSYWQFGISPLGSPTRVLLVQCHPLGDSFSAACAKAAAKGLREAGHDVRVRTLYYDNNGELGQAYNGRDFPPALTANERREYHSIAAKPEQLAPEVQDAVADLRWAQALVLVYPTWWFNVPGTLKGFLDRTFLPHVAFRLPKNMLEGDTGPTETGLQPLLTNIGRVGVVSTYGASAGVVFGAGDNGRRMWSQGLRPLFAPGCCLRWNALYELDMITPAQRADFLAQVERAYRNF